MPCVFPVLSIKVLGLVELAGGARQEVRRHGLAYTAGVLAAFAALGAAAPRPARRRHARSAGASSCSRR